LIAITGLVAEARIAAGPGISTFAGGGDAVKLEATLEQAVAAGGKAFISFGIAGGLAPHLKPGARLVARAIITGSERLPTDPEWSQRLAALMGGAEIADFVGVDTPVSHPDKKRALYTATGAVAADMESHIVARVASRHRLPFAAFRVVADPVGRALPHAALVGMKADGSVDLAAVLRSLAKRPNQLPSLLRLATDTRTAFAALFSGRQMLGPAFGFGDLGELVLDMA